MRPLALDDLPTHSVWARYLLDPTGDPPDTPEAYTGVELYEEMYAELLAKYRDEPVSSGEFTETVYAAGRDDPGPVSVREELFLANVRNPSERRADLRRSLISAAATAPHLSRSPSRFRTRKSSVGSIAKRASTSHKNSIMNATEYRSSGSTFETAGRSLTTPLNRSCSPGVS